MEVGPFTFEVRHTPGHSPGSVSFIFDEARFAVVGDTLFQRKCRKNRFAGWKYECSTQLHP